MNQLDLNFINGAKELLPEYFIGKKILEIGAQDVNGDLRDPFTNCEFTGIDWVPGKNVDIVVAAKDTEFPSDTFDVLLSANHLEHDPDWQESLGHNMPALKQNGLILLRWAGIGSSPHGPEYDPRGEQGYYPKSMAHLLTFLLAQNVEIVKQYGDVNPYIGPMLNIIAKKL